MNSPDAVFREVQRILSEHCGTTILPEYTQLKQLKKYVARRGFGSVSEYLAHVRQDPETELPHLYDQALVHATRVYRDASFWRNFTSRALARQLAEYRILCLGCSTGAEIATVMALARQRFEPEQLHLDAWDLSPACVEAAKNPRVAARFVAQIPNLDRKVFLPSGGRFVRLCPELLERIHVHQGNVLELDDDWWQQNSGYHLVLCRNLLVYLRPPAVSTIFRGIWQVLAPRGFLGIGSVDPQPPGSLFQPAGEMLFQQVPQKPR